VSARSDEDGVLILSRFTGSARELTPALLINPYAIDDFAETIQAALTMAAPERRTRMRRLRRIVAANNIYGWATSIVEKISDLSEEV
jgi:trehalose 6-phosphate synthase